MTFSRAFRLSSNLLLLAGFNALFTAGAAGPWLAALFLGALAVNWKWGEFHVSQGMQATLFFVFLAFFAVDLALVSGLVQSSVHLLVLISLVKALSEKRDRDYLLMYCISFTFLLIASTYTISVLFLASLIFYFFLCILTFILFESKKAYEDNPRATFSIRSYAQAAALITALIAVLSVPIFLAVPRAAWGLFRAPETFGSNLSGFSDRVNLGDIGRIIANRSVFMRVEVDRPPEALPVDLKWRGIALDHFDGGAWTNTERDYYQIVEESYPQSRSAERAKRFIVPAQRRSDESLLSQNITVEPSSKIIFGADRILQVAGNRIPGQTILRDQNGTLSFYRNPADSLRYTVHSDLESRARQLRRIRPGRIPDEVRRRYLQLPKLDPRIPEMARRLTAARSSPAAKALMLENHLRTGFAYSLDNRSANAADPLSDFLFDSRSGHCEYFATSMAVMLRVLGIPSRVVNGFRRGEYNQWSDYWIVRQSDAHSWVEAYFPGVGWVDFDATPAARGDASYYAARLASQFLDAVDVFWTEVVTFDRIKQYSFFVRLGSNLRGSVDRFSLSLYRLDYFGRKVWKGAREWEGPGWFGAFAVLAAAAGSLILWRRRASLWLFWKKTVLRKSPSELAPSYYLELLEILRRKGFVRSRSETPGEFLQRVGDRLDPRPAAAITDYYYRSRYGNHPLRQGDLDEIQHCLRRLKSAPRAG